MTAEKKSDLDKLGWNEFFNEQFSKYSGGEYLAGRVAIENKSNYLIYTQYGEYTGELSGKFYFDSQSRGGLPAVGDWVVFRPVHDEKKAVIENVLLRKNKFSRKTVLEKTEEQIISSNIDFIFIVTSLNLEFNIKRIGRYLTIAGENKVTPVIILNKADLSENKDKIAEEVKSAFAGVEIHIISAADKTGTSELKKYFTDNRTVAVVGSSGVGKSTLINVLAGNDMIPVNEIGGYKDKGKHTTTKRELILLPGGGIIIDTPGMREVQLWQGNEGLSETFADVEKYFSECKFSDCNHETEPGCAVKKAISDGELEESRYENYLKLQKEINWLENRKDKKVKSDQKKKWKKITNAVRNNPSKK